MPSLIPPPSGAGGRRDPDSLLTNALARSGASGIETDVDKGGSFLDQAKKVSGGGLLTALDWLGRPGQAVLRGIQGQQTGSGVLRGIGRGFTGSTDGFRWRSEDTTNLRGALNTDNFMADRGYVNEDAERAAEKQGGRVAGAFDFVGSAILDPTTYLTMGVGKAATTTGQVAAEQLAKQGADDIARKVTENAGKRAIKDVLDDKEMKVLREALKQSDEALNAKNTNKFVNQAVRNLNQPSGVRFAGKQILDAETLRPAAEATRLVGRTDETGQLINRGLSNVVGDSRIVEASSKAIKPRYEAAQAFGQQAADSIGRLGRRASAEEALSTTEAVNRLNAAAKVANVTEDELRNIYTPARDANKLQDLAKTFDDAGDAGRAALARELDAMPRSVKNSNVVRAAAEGAEGVAKQSDELNDAVKTKARANIEASRARVALRDLDDSNLTPEARAKIDDARRVEVEATQTARAAQDEVRIARQEATKVKAAANAEVSRARAALNQVRQEANNLGGLGRVPKNILRGRTVNIAREEAAQAVKAAEKRLKDAEKAATKATKEFDRLGEKASKVTQQADERAAKAIATATERAQKAVQTELKNNANKAGTSAAKATDNIAKAKETLAKAQERAAQQNRTAIELTPAGNKAVRDRAGALSKKLDISAAEVSRIARTGSLPQGITREEFEAAAKEVSRSTKDMVEKNTLKAAALSTQRAYAEQARDNMYRGLADVKDAQGNDLFSDTAKNGFEAVELSDGTKVYVPTEIKKEFSRVDAILTNDESIRAFERVIDNWQKWWRATATVPFIPGGFGFHMRNAQGNMFNNFLAGVKDPRVYTTAGKLQTAIEKATRSKEPFADAIRNQGLSDREVRIITEARERGTIGDFLVQADQEIDPLVRETSRKKAVAKGANPFDRKNFIGTRTGTWIGRQVETNARLAHFIDVVNKTGSFEQADESVRKFLFDYADLTPIEQKVFRRYVPFYTYMRKNTPLQFEQLFAQPGKYAALANFYNQAALQSDDETDKDIPKYLLESGAVPITGGDNPMMLSVDTPFSAALRVTKPATSLLGMIGGEANPLRPEGGKEEAARDFVNQFGGGPVELAKFGLSQATGKDLFTGADISKEDDVQTADRLAKALAPLYGKGRAVQKDVTSDDPADKRSRLLDAITGANATAVTDKRSEGEQYRKLEIVSNAIAAAKADGIDVPSTSELQKAGVVPTPPKTKKPRKARVKKQRVKKTPLQKAKARRAKALKPKKPPTP